MRLRAIVLALVGFTLLACSGAVLGDGKGKGKRKGGKSPATEEPSGGGGLFDGLPGMGDGGGEDGEEEADDGSGDGDEGGGGGGGGASPKPSPGPSPAPSTPPAGIEQVNSTTWNVSQEKKAAILSNPGKFAGASKKGKGYQLSSIKSGSDAWYMGLRNGDIVKEVNGHSLATEAEAIAAYGALQDSTKLRVKLKRGEGPLNHIYNIQ